MQVGCIKLCGQIQADTVILCKIAVESLTVAHLIGDDTAITQHTTLVHRVGEHLLRQAVQTCHGLGRTFETERLCQRKVSIEHGHRLLLNIYALQSTPEELLAHFRLVATIVEKAQSHIRDIKILFLMMLFYIISDMMNFDEGTMEMLMVHFIYHAIQPCAIVFVPLLASL